MTTLTGYHLGETLYQGTRTLVYRGTRTADNQSVIIKFLRNQYPTFSELVQFRNQYTIAKNLDLPGIVQPLALETYGNGYALVMADEGYVSLAEWRQGQFSLPDFLIIATQLVEILHGLYRNRVIHKDIKPANILIHPETKHVKLIDFSISSLLPKETQEIRNPNLLEGTLAYISPEQTGRMNRGVDYRTDFYSLGVTFYKFLTGKLPFQSDDPMELVHCHIAKSPTFPHTPHPTPHTLLQIVLKLMAKNAEDRYQSALGLKYDLEKCLYQWKEAQRIEPFELGERDICDRFTIPEKLYGREKEVQMLLDAFERVASPPENRVAQGKTELMLVAGFSGIGKTAVINEVHKPIVKNRGYFIKGKFDQFNRNIPFSAFVQAFRSLIGQILSESDAELKRSKTKILEALGENGQVLIDVIPELEIVIGKQPSVPELSGNAAQNRFHLLFEKFIAVFTTPEHPLVMFLDDLQWADSASLNLIEVLMGDSDRGYLLLLGAYRDNEVFPAHPLMLTLAELTKQCDPAPVRGAREHALREQEAAISTITLSPLSIHHINRLVAETLSCQVKQAQPLTELVYQKTKGNPFFTTQFLKGLYEDDLIVFNPNLGYWECDLVQVRDAALTDNVAEFMARRLQKLPAATQEVLKLAACIGNQFDLETLAILCETPLEEVATNLWSALREGLILPQSEAYKFFQEWEKDEDKTDGVVVGYRFLHDRVQQAAYSLIESVRKQSTHFKIGQKLLKNTPKKTLDKKIFAIVNQLNIGIESADIDFDLSQIARLNLIAGKQAKATTAYQAAVKYLAVARNSIPTSSWDENYNFTLEIYQESAEAAYLSADFEEMEKFIAIVQTRARTLLDTIPVYEVKMQAGMAQNKLSEAIQTGREILQSLGIVFPENPTPSDIETTISSIFSNIAGRNPVSLIELPLMTDPAKLASMRILQSLAPCAYQAMPMLLPLVVIKQVELSLDYGNTALSPLGYSYFALILCGVVGDIETGYQFGQLALALLDRLEAKEIQSGTIFVVNADVKHYREAVKDTLQPLQSAYTLGLETGDLEFAALSTYIYVYHAYLVGLALPELERRIDNYNRALEKLKQKNALHFNQILHQSVLNLMGIGDEPCKLKGAVYNALEMLPIHQTANDATAIYYVYFNQMILCYLLEEFQPAVENAAKAEQYLYGVTANLVVPIFYFYDSLIQLTRSKLELECNPKDTLENAIEKVRGNQEKMQTWANYAPMNFQHKHDLVEAERCRVLGRKLEAIEYYDRAIAGAKSNEYLQEEALANELAAKFYLDWSKEKVAAGYIQEAYYCYARWGAKAKTDDLEQRYPNLLQPILQAAVQTLNPIDTLTTLAGFNSSIDAATKTSCSSTSSINNTLDFASILKASQALSSTIQLDELLRQLTQIILQNAGGDRCALILPEHDGEWYVAAIAAPEATELCSEPLQDNPRLPVRLIQYVKNTQETVVVDDLNTDLPVIDDYLQQRQPKSLLCLPIFDRGKTIGILYVTNHSTSGAFTEDRILVLNFLCTQAAISLENARLYQQAQDYAQQLERSQLQLVQSEKMSALGNLVAGVAHEINNPVGFIGGNIQPARDYVQDLLGLIDLYQEENPTPGEAIEEELEAIDLDFLREDLPKLIDSMKLGVERIAHISTSLRTFSRTDKEHKVPFNLHEGIDSTLLILKHRLKANENRPAIEIVKEYGDIPPVQCFPGQLNQVFMNLIANAIDALDEGNRERSFEEISANPNWITIVTEATLEQVTIRISDNGMGMPEAVQKRIFEQGFTTKGVGKGTGLGMAIARQIVEEKHGGTIACTSEFGKGAEFKIALPLS